MAEITREFIMSEVQRRKSYTVLLLKRGPNYDTTQEIQIEHLKEVFRQRAIGEQLITLPVREQDSELVGIGVFASADADHVAQLAAGDPGVQAGRFTFETLAVMGLPGDTLT